MEPETPETPAERLERLACELTLEARQLMQRKNHDYTSGSGDPYANFRMSGSLGVAPVVGLLLRMSDKMQRLRTFAEKGELQVQDEGLRDAVIDLINYSVLAYGLATEGSEKQAAKSSAQGPREFIGAALRCRNSSTSPWQPYYGDILRMEAESRPTEIRLEILVEAEELPWVMKETEDALEKDFKLLTPDDSIAFRAVPVFEKLQQDIDERTRIWIRFLVKGIVEVIDTP